MIQSLIRRIRGARTRTALALAVAAFCCGCSRAPEADRFVPAAELARAALEAVLVDWQAGLPAEMIQRLSVQVYPIDNQRKKGEELAGFEILGEVPQPGVRCFAVRLKFHNSAEDAKVRYVVHGIDPLYVYRQEDFDLLNHWDHLMPVEVVSQAGAETPDPIPDQPAPPESSDE
jgi:hypothetical protein